MLTDFSRNATISLESFLERVEHECSPSFYYAPLPSSGNERQRGTLFEF